MGDTITVLFVDDEPAILRGLERQMLTATAGSEFCAVMNRLYAGDAAEALNMMAQTNCDIVVADMRMPGMDGAALLNVVRNKYPQTVRIILSGYADGGDKLLTTGLAHQYLAKPCDPEILHTMLQGICHLRSMLHNDGLKKILAQMSTVPSLPELYWNIMREIQSPTSSLKRVGKIVSQDSGMTAKILQLVNSAYFGLPQQVTTAAQAVVLLGLDTIKALMLSVHIFTQFEQQLLKDNFSLQEFQTHTLTVAALARCIARQQGADQQTTDIAFTAGILHDVGKLLLMTNLSEQYHWVRSMAHRRHLLPVEAEQHVFNTTHAVVGAYLLNLWGLPYPIVETVAYHHNPGDCLHRQFTPLTAVHVANAWFYQFQATSEEYRLPQLDMAYLEQLDLLEQLPVWETNCSNLLSQDFSE